MGDLRYRFTLSHSSGTQVISEPEGWKDIKMVLERSPEYFSLIELFEVPMIFYGNNGEHDGGKDFILSVESGYGINENIEILIEASEDELEWDTLWEGLLNMETINEIDDHRVSVSLLKDDLWAKFKNREDIPVDLLSETDHDGNAVDVIVPGDLVLSGQIIRYLSEYRWQFGTKYPDDGVNGSLTLDWDQTIKDDIKKFSVARVKNLLYTAGSETYTYSAPQFEAPWDGDYEFDVRLEAAEISADRTLWLSGSMNPRIQIAGAALGPVNFTDTLMPGNYRVYTFQGTFSLRKGDQVVIFGTSGSDIEVFGETRLIYKTEARLATTGNITLSGEQNIDGQMTSSDRVLVWKQGTPSENGIYLSDAGVWTRVTDNNSTAEMLNAAVYITDGDANSNAAFRQTATVNTIDTDPVIWEFLIHSFERFLPYPGVGPVENYVTIKAFTTSPDTTSEGLLIHDAVSEVIKRTTGATVVSELFGSPLTSSRTYSEYGCEWNHILLKGLHLRGYDMAEKLFFLSFKDWWNGANPIFNLGLSYELYEGEQVIRIEDKAYFFDPDPIIYLNWVNKIKRDYDKNHIIKAIMIGYEKWQAEEISGLDDPQTKKAYATIFKLIGTDKTLYSKFIAAALATEVTRRKTIDQSTDYKFDNDTFIIAVKQTLLDSPVNAFAPELNENFSSITGLLDAETRYNMFLTPSRNFLRWANYFNGSLQKYLTSVYKFVSGEGNYAMSSQYDCGSGPKADCQGTVCFDVAENGDLSVGDVDDVTGHLFTPETLEFEHPLSWTEYKAIRDNRTRAIGVSKTDGNHMICFISRIEYDINKSNAKFVVWKR